MAWLSCAFFDFSQKENVATLSPYVRAFFFLVINHEYVAGDIVGVVLLCHGL
jgi:hypothetical protein